MVICEVVQEQFACLGARGIALVARALVTFNVTSKKPNKLNLSLLILGMFLFNVSRCFLVKGIERPVGRSLVIEYGYDEFMSINVRLYSSEIGFMAELNPPRYEDSMKLCVL
jgi:hypothetical protein